MQTFDHNREIAVLVSIVFLNDTKRSRTHPSVPRQPDPENRRTRTWKQCFTPAGNRAKISSPPSKSVEGASKTGLSADTPPASQPAPCAWISHPFHRSAVLQGLRLCLEHAKGGFLSMAAFKNHRGQGRSGAAVAILFLASAPGNSQPFLFLSGIGGSSSAGSSRAEPWSMTLGETPGTGPGAGFLRGRRFPTLLASVGPGGQPSRDGETLGASWGTDRSQRSRRRRLGWGQVRGVISVGDGEDSIAWARKRSTITH